MGLERLVWVLTLLSAAAMLPVVPDVNMSNVDNEPHSTRTLKFKLNEANEFQHVERQRLQESTEKPSPTPTRPHRLVFGVGVGIIVLCSLGSFCVLLCGALYHGQVMYFTKLYQKKYNTAVCCIFWFGLVVLYLYLAPRQSQYVQHQHVVRL
jgi:hypothetical protein